MVYLCQIVRSISEVLAWAKLFEWEQRLYSHTFILPKARKSIEKVNVKSEVTGQQKGRMTVIFQRRDIRSLFYLKQIRNVRKE